MKKRILSLLLVLMLCAALAVTAFATGTEAFVYDDADLLTASEEAALEQKLSQISQAYEAQVIVATIDSLEGTDIDRYLNFTYDTLGFGYGQNHDGVLLLVCMDPREYRILSNGFAGEAIDTAAIEKMGDAFVSDLSDGYYSDAFDTYADKCEYYLNGYINGFPFNFGKALLISLVIGLLVAISITKGWKKQLKSVRKQDKANVYVKTGSMQITQSGDYFMYRNVARTARPKESSSSRSSGGSSRSTGGGSF